jgi:hypothetical protein
LNCAGKQQPDQRNFQAISSTRFVYLYIWVSKLINRCCTATASIVFRFTHAHVSAMRSALQRGQCSSAALLDVCATSPLQLAAAKVKVIERKHVTARRISTVQQTQSRLKIKNMVCIEQTASFQVVAQAKPCVCTTYVPVSTDASSCSSPSAGEFSNDPVC